MNDLFKKGFEKTAKVPYQKILSGTEWLSNIAQKRAANALGRGAQKAAITRSYGGTAAQASSVRMTPPKSRPLVPSTPKTTKIPQHDERFMTRSMWQNALK